MMALFNFKKSKNIDLLCSIRGQKSCYFRGRKSRNIRGQKYRNFRGQKSLSIRGQKSRNITIRGRNIKRKIFVVHLIVNRFASCST